MSAKTNTAPSLVILATLAACDPGGDGAPALALSGHAQAATNTEAPVMVSPAKYLRQLSLDLRGRPPSGAEIEGVARAGRVSPQLIDGILKSPEFLAQVRAWHAEVLWPNLDRYRMKAVSLTAFRSHPSVSTPYLLGTGLYNISPDPSLSLDEAARQQYVVAIEPEGFGIAVRGGGHSRGNYYCDLRPEAEYPDPSAVGTPANQYVVPAERSGTGRSYSAKYYSEESDTYGLVLPLRDYEHCANYCRRQDCSLASGEDRRNLGPTEGCFRDMDTPGDDPSGRHELDLPGMRCADGYVREINECHFWNELTPINNYRFNGLPVRRRVRPYRRTQGLTTYGNHRDGWRWMEHYWSRGKKVKTCAIEAQEREFGILFKNMDGKPVSCEEALAASQSFNIVDPSCGCGPRGAYCQPSLAAHATPYESDAEFRLRKAIEQEPLEIINSVIARDEDYLDILTTKRSFVNGSLAFAYRNQAKVIKGEGFDGISTPGPHDPLWDKVPYTNEGWTGYVRPGRHSGILTTLGFLLRFPTARARIAQYRRSFLCSSEFDYAPQPDPEDINPDIALRNGCASCHLRLETEGMWFARYPDRTGKHLEADKYPAVSEACRLCASRPPACEMGAANPHVPGGVVSDPELRTVCSKFYVPSKGATDRERPYIGTLRPGIYRDEALFSRMDMGPEKMVRSDIAAGTALQACAAQTAWERLVRRPLRTDESKALLETFEKNGRNYRALIRAIVTGDAYQTVQP